MMPSGGSWTSPRQSDISITIILRSLMMMTVFLSAAKHVRCCLFWRAPLLLVPAAVGFFRLPLLVSSGAPPTPVGAFLSELSAGANADPAPHFVQRPLLELVQ